MSYDEHLISMAGGDGDTIDQLADIEARANAATPGPWKADTGTRGDCVVWGPNGRFLMNMQAEPHWLEYPGEKRSVSFDVDARDAEFIAHARTNVPALLALVREQDAKLEAVEGICSDWDAVVDVFPLTPAALFAGSHAKRVRAALTATEER